MNDKLKWFLVTMSAYLRVRDGSTYTITNIGTDLFKFGKYIRGTITGISGTVLWDSTGRLVYPTTYANGNKNLVLKMTLAQLTSAGLTPQSLTDFLTVTGGYFGTYGSSPTATVSEYHVGVNEQIIRMVGNISGSPKEWSPAGEPLSGNINDKLGLLSEISNYPEIYGYASNYSPVINQVALKAVLSGSTATLDHYFADLSLTVYEYRGAVAGVSGSQKWDGSGNHSTDPNLNLVDIVTLANFNSNY